MFCIILSGLSRRFLIFLAENEVLYDGAVFFDTPGRIFPHFRSPSEHDARCLGLVIMLPNWLAEIYNKASVQQLIKWVEAVMSQQYKIFLETKLNPDDNHIKSATDTICQVIRTSYAAIANSVQCGNTFFLNCIIVCLCVI